ncbi:trypsin-1-like [Oratosquilla oratoria]|uniref:trypsin-1-like n=1 Tax=Oratosquilla oratoria TaxID=337810 RepID=UPI003F7776A3
MDAENPDTLQITTGEHNLDIPEGHEQTVAVSRIIRHEDFDGWNVANDIALLRLQSLIAMNDFAQPIDLPRPFQGSSGDCEVSGWGSTAEGGSSSRTLMKVTLPIVPDTQCRADYGQEMIADSMICAGFSEGGKDACQGDSGGPLVCVRSGTGKYLAGIVSWGYGCGLPNFPGVYTEVSYFVDWIQKNAV